MLGFLPRVGYYHYYRVTSEAVWHIETHGGVGACDLLFYKTAQNITNYKNKHKYKCTSKHWIHCYTVTICRLVTIIHHSVILNGKLCAAHWQCNVCSTFHFSLPCMQVLCTDSHCTGTFTWGRTCRDALVWQALGHQMPAKCLCQA